MEARRLRGPCRPSMPLAAVRKLRSIAVPGHRPTPTAGPSRLPHGPGRRASAYGRSPVLTGGCAGARPGAPGRRRAARDAGPEPRLRRWPAAAAPRTASVLPVTRPGGEIMSRSRAAKRPIGVTYCTSAKGRRKLRSLPQRAGGPQAGNLPARKVSENASSLVSAMLVRSLRARSASPRSVTARAQPGSGLACGPECRAAAAVLRCCTSTRRYGLRSSKYVRDLCGAMGIRTPDLLHAMNDSAIPRPGHMQFDQPLR